jgi:hypothetical protein
MSPQEDQKSMGDDTKRYLASFIKDLRGKSEVPAQDSITPPTPKTDSSGPGLFSSGPGLFKGSLLGGDASGTNPLPGKPGSSNPADAKKIVLSDKEKEMLKRFSKLK